MEDKIYDLVLDKIINGATMLSYLIDSHYFIFGNSKEEAEICEKITWEVVVCGIGFILLF